MTEAQQLFYQLGVALAIGLLVGIERGWQERKLKEGTRIAGVRTYGLIGLLGGVSALLANRFGALVMGLAFVAMTLLVTAVYAVNLRRGDEDVGITSLVASLLTFVFGALAVLGEVPVAAAFAVITTLLLSYKPVLHSWVSALEGKELRAGIRLLLISVVLLPVLPNQGYGPWQALNPYTIWWLVVLIASISFVGYFALKLAGTRRGAVYTGLFGGLASSTALTLHFSRMAKRHNELAPVLAMGVLLACGTMFPRMVFVAALLNPALFRALLLPAVVMALITYLPAIHYWRAQQTYQATQTSPLHNPLQLKTALLFGVLLAAIMLAGKALKEWVGDAGVLVLAVASGVADVDAITLSLARLSGQDLALNVATMGIVVAAAVNSITKGVIAAVVGGRGIGLRVGLPLLAGAVSGLLVAWVWVW